MKIVLNTNTFDYLHTNALHCQQLTQQMMGRNTPSKESLKCILFTFPLRYCNSAYMYVRLYVRSAFMTKAAYVGLFHFLQSTYDYEYINN